MLMMGVSDEEVADPVVKGPDFTRIPIILTICVHMVWLRVQRHIHWLSACRGVEAWEKFAIQHCQSYIGPCAKHV
eukprot:361456-Chlamydomonas_euryale.AAC.4